jgi:hypothetical protein
VHEDVRRSRSRPLDRSGREDELLLAGLRGIPDGRGELLPMDDREPVARRGEVEVLEVLRRVPEIVGDHRQATEPVPNDPRGDEERVLGTRTPRDAEAPVARKPDRGAQADGRQLGAVDVGLQRDAVVAVGGAEDPEHPLVVELREGAQHGAARTVGQPLRVAFDELDGSVQAPVGSEVVERQLQHVAPPLGGELRFGHQEADADGIHGAVAPSGWPRLGRGYPPRPAG